MNKVRSSNFELLRIILMFSVVMHHCIFASGIEQLYDLNNNFTNTVILQCLGAWGKTAINVFVLITGYFMCKSKLTWKKIVKLFFEIKFYEFLLYSILCILGYQQKSFETIVKLFFSIGVNINHSFVGTFVVFYLFIPVLNRLINNMDKIFYRKLLLLLFGIFTLTSTFLSNYNIFSHLSWYIVLYFFAAYFRIYPSNWMDNRRLNCFWALFFIVLAYCSIILIDVIDIKMQISISCYYFIINSNKIFAFLISIFIFLWFKNINIKNNIFINTIASGTFGVLLIHTNGQGMNKLIWNDFFDIPSYINSYPYEIVIYVFISSLVVFLVCDLIDLVRINTVEKLLFNFIAKNEMRINRILTQLNNKIEKSPW